MKTDLFQSCGHCWVLQICWHLGGSIFTASSFSIWNSSTGIPSPPLALFIMMLPKALWHRTSGCLALGEWSHHRGYLGHKDLFLDSSSVYSSHLFLISSASVRSIPFLSFWAHLCLKCSHDISNFLEEISSLSHFVVFLYVFALISEEGFLISPCYSLELCIQMGISFLFSFAFIFSFLSSLCVCVCVCVCVYLYVHLTSERNTHTQKTCKSLRNIRFGLQESQQS